MSNNNNNNNNFDNKSNNNNAASGSFDVFNMKNQMILSLLVGILFFVVAAPFMYTFTNKIAMSLGFSGFINENGSVSTWGVLLHAAFFCLLSYVGIKVVLHFFPNGFKLQHHKKHHF